jgi:hypothetical protein
MAVPFRYLILSRTGYALSINPQNRRPGGQLILAGQNVESFDQRWTWIYYPLTQASILFNPHYDYFAAPKTIEKGAPIVLFAVGSPPRFDGKNTWQIVGDGYDAVRPPADTDLNMNAFGSSWGPGTEVGLWTWDSGSQPNEVWASKLIAPT